jgi:hypothetical protein
MEDRERRSLGPKPVEDTALWAGMGISRLACTHVRLPESD